MLDQHQRVGKFVKSLFTQIPFTKQDDLPVRMEGKLLRRQLTRTTTQYFEKYSQTPCNSHLSTMATSLQQWPLYFVPADSPYIDSYLNLSTTATKTSPQQPK